MKMFLQNFKRSKSAIFAFLMCFCLSLPLMAQERIMVSGVILDTQKQPLIGASVVEQGTTNGVITDLDGRYEISVSADATLDFSYMGYVSKSEAVMNRTTINMTLEQDAVALDQVVAIGYGSQRKEDLSMAVSSVKLDDVARSRAADLGTLLQGRLPGVTVQQSGDPLQKSSFSIRGRGSKGNDGDPTSGDGVLVVVDGVPNAPYIPEDIESITILKDAASAAIYGASVGSSGVVLITTRSAQAGETRVSVNISSGFQQATNLPTMLNAQQFCDVWGVAVDNSTNGTLPTLANPSAYAGANVTQTDWLDEIFQTGKTQHYGISISGGNEKLKSILSVAYDKKEGTILNTYSENLGAKLNTELKVNDWLKITERVSMDYFNGQGNISTSHTGPIMGAMWFPSSAGIYDVDANGNVIYDASGNPAWGGIASSTDMANGVQGPNIVNPVARLETMYGRNPQTQLFSTTSVEVRPYSRLTLKSDFTADLTFGESDGYAPVLDVPGGSSVSSREQFNTNNFNYLWESTANYAERFGRHSISALAGFTMSKSKLHYRRFETEGYSDASGDKLIWGSAGAWSSNPTESIYEYSMMSVLGRVAYSFDDRYFVTASMRRDASSKLPAHNNADVFPSVSASWKLTSEKFFKDLNVGHIVNLIKFRGGWGRIGNVDLYPLTSSTDIPLLSYNDGSWIGGNTVYGTYLSTIPNPNARWETTEQTSFGIDFGLLKNKLEVSVDYYNKETIDLIDELPTPSQLGVENAPLGNMGNVTNKGWEFSVSYNNTFANGEGSYNVWGTFSTNEGVVNDYGPQERVEHTTPNLNSQSILSSGAGHPWYSYYIYQTDGIFRSQAEIDSHVTKNPETGEIVPLQPNALVGDLKFVDTNGDGVINDDDRQMTGSYAPKQTFSLGGSIYWKNFDFSILLQGVAGNYIYNGMKQMSMNGRQDLGNLSTDVYQTWDFDNANSKYPRLGIVEDDNGNYLKFSDMFLEKGDYLRIKNITVGYTLPSKIVRRSGLDNLSVRFYASVDNAATFTGYTGIDPEVGNYGVDRGVYPVSRLYNFGVNVNF